MVKVDVYGDPRSTCTQRVLILLEELDLKYDLKKIDLISFGIFLSSRPLDL